MHSPAHIGFLARARRLRTPAAILGCIPRRMVYDNQVVRMMTMRLTKRIAVAALAAVFAVGAVAGVPAEKKTPAKPAKVKPYPLETCVVSGQKLGGDMGEPSVFTYQGQEIKLCCKGCEKEFKKNPAKYLAKIEEAAKKLKPYPLDTCVVTGEKFGGMGEPYVFVYQGREIKLCCKGCLKEFKKDPAKYLKQIEAAEQKGGK